MTRTTFNTSICLFSALLLAPTVQADSTLTMNDAAGKMDSIIEVKGHMVRMSSPGEMDYMLYDAQRDTVIHVSNTNQQYMEIDRAGLAEMAESMTRIKREMSPQMAMMRERLKSMPPEQRAIIEQRMGGMAELGAVETKAVTKVTTVKRGNDKVAPPTNLNGVRTKPPPSFGLKQRRNWRWRWPPPKSGKNPPHCSPLPRLSI